MNRVALALAAAVAVAAMARAASAAPIEYTAGHADIRPVYENGEMALKYRFDTAAVLYGIPNLSPTLHGPPEAYVRVPNSTIKDPSVFASSPAFFQALGSPTEPLWVLPQNNVPGQPYFGFSTEELAFFDWGIDFEIELTNFSGPGHFTLYQFGPFGQPIPKISTADGIDFFAFPKGHDHFNWAFLESGVYELQFTITGTLLVDGVKSATGTFLFAVGDTTTIVPEASSLLLCGIGGAFVTVVRARRRQLRWVKQRWGSGGCPPRELVAASRGKPIEVSRSCQRHEYHEYVALLQKIRKSTMPVKSML